MTLVSYSLDLLWLSAQPMNSWFHTTMDATFPTIFKTQLEAYQLLIYACTYLTNLNYALVVSETWNFRRTVGTFEDQGRKVRKPNNVRVAGDASIDGTECFALHGAPQLRDSDRQRPRTWYCMPYPVGWKIDSVRPCHDGFSSEQKDRGFQRLTWEEGDPQLEVASKP
ncbi:hypothetical protein C8R42DRAFT_637606 [Lentinula raphanica]|nr:hypothetical protein C8R42DRAFT_637606 [Lentinula raphanica]